MRPVVRIRNPWLFRKSYHPKPVIRIRPEHKADMVVRLLRAGSHLKPYEYSIH
jgi:hypothetical protein